MNFAEVIRNLRAKRNLPTCKDYYEELGGKKVLGISLRHFQQIEADKYQPSEKLLLAMFLRTSASEHRELIVGFFKSVSGKESESHPIIQYLEQYLSPELEHEKKSIWEDSNRRMLVYSEEQLEFLLSNVDAMRLHRKILLFGETGFDEVRLDSERLKKMVDLELIEIRPNEKKIYASRLLYRIPHYDNSPPRLVGRATDYILKQAEVFSAREGSADQELSYAMQLVSVENAQKIIQQMKYFKRWVQSLGSLDRSQKTVPLLFLGLVRRIDRKEFS